MNGLVIGLDWIEGEEEEEEVGGVDGQVGRGSEKVGIYVYIHNEIDKYLRQVTLSITESSVSQNSKGDCSTTCTQFGAGLRQVRSEVIHLLGGFS